MTQYPGPDPDDPFSRPPNEQGARNPHRMDETAPIQSEEVGYWERKAQEDQQRLADEASQPAQQQPGEQPPAEQPPGQVQPHQPEPENPWSGYGQPAPTTPYQQGYPQPAYGQPSYGQQPGYPAYGYAVQPPNHPQSTTALVLGLVGLIGGCVCGLPLLVAPFAWVVGAKARREIAASNGQLGGAGNAQAGFIMGIIGTVLLVLGVIALVLVIGVSIATDSGSSGTSTQF